MSDYKDNLNDFFDDDKGLNEEERTQIYSASPKKEAHAPKKKHKHVKKSALETSIDKLKDIKLPMPKKSSEGKKSKSKKQSTQSSVEKLKTSFETSTFNPVSEENFRPEEAGNPIRFRKERHSGILGGILYFLFVVGVSTLLACAGWIAATDVLALGKPESAINVTVPENFELDDVANLLHDNGLIENRSLFKFYGKLSHAQDKISAGTYELYTNYDYRALVNGMTAAGGTRVSVKVTVPEGYTLLQTFTLLEESGVCKADKLWECATNYDFEYDFLADEPIGNNKRLEGYLFPDTYEFYMGQAPELVIDKFLKNFDNRLSDDYRKAIEESGYSLHEILTIASLIEEEAAGDADRGNISSVIYNRLNKKSTFPHLQIDASINYVIAETGEPFSIDIDSPYNTYVCEGLPIGPISNPGMAAIKAAVYPEDTSYYFYALDIYGEHRFFTNSSDFDEFVFSSDYVGN